MRPCEIVAKCPLPFAYYKSFKLFQISTSQFCTVGIHRRLWACTDEFLSRVTEGIVHGVHKVVTQSYFSVTHQHKVS